MAPSPYSEFHYVGRVPLTFSFGLYAEMRDKRQYTKSMVICHVFFNSLYVLIGVIVYWFCGQFVAYPVSPQCLPSGIELTTRLLARPVS